MMNEDKWATTNKAPCAYLHFNPMPELPRCEHPQCESSSWLLMSFTVGVFNGEVTHLLLCGLHRVQLALALYKQEKPSAA